LPMYVNVLQVEGIAICMVEAIGTVEVYISSLDHVMSYNCKRVTELYAIK